MPRTCPRRSLCRGAFGGRARQGSSTEWSDVPKFRCAHGCCSPLRHDQITTKALVRYGVLIVRERFDRALVIDCGPHYVVVSHSGHGWSWRPRRTVHGVRFLGRAERQRPSRSEWVDSGGIDRLFEKETWLESASMIFMVARRARCLRSCGIAVG